MTHSNNLDEATKRLIRPNLALPGLGVFHLWTWVSAERTVKGN